MAQRKYYCFVPECTNTSLRCPDKVFVSVPKKENLRRMWLKASRRDMVKSPISPKCNLTCCEDHFDLENDVENWTRYKFYKEAGLKANIRLKEGVIPHKFHCQKGKNVISTVSRLSVGTKMQRKKMIENLLSAGSSASSVQGEYIPNLECQDENEVPYQQYVERDNANMVDRSIQVVSCKFIQAELLKNIDQSYSIDVGTQMTPTKRMRLQSSEDGTHSTITSGVGSERVQSSSSIKEERGEIKSKIINDKALEVNLHQTKAHAKLYVGITDRCYFFIIETLSNLIGCFPKNIILVLRKIKFNTLYELLGDDFGISGRQASRVFYLTLPKVAVHLRQLILWPPQEVIEQLLPIPFRRRYSKVQSIIDFFEVRIEKPSDHIKQSLTWSEYYKANTCKYLVSATPHGFINFISKGYGGSTTDTNLTEHCGFLDCLSGGMEVMADRGFKHIATTLKARGVTLVRPPSVRSGEKLENTEVMRAKRTASVRIHIERIIGRIHCYDILSEKNIVDNKLIRYLDDVVLVVGGLVNLCDPLFL